MKHYTEHELEMFVLEEESLAGQRSEIESHLAGCEGCRTLARTIGTFYAQARAERKEIGASRKEGGLPVIRKKKSVTPLYEPLAPPAVFRDGRWIGRAAHIVRRHPVGSAAGTVVLGALVLAGLLTITRPLVGGKNPSYATINALAGELRVYNASDVMLWSKPIVNLQTFLGAGTIDMQRYVAIADIDRDGTNEVITSLPLGDDKLLRHLSVLNSTGALRAELRIGEPLMCRGRQYPDDFQLTWFAVDPPDSTSPGSIIVSASNRNSPAIISRYDTKLQRVGTYRHFGHLGLMVRFDVEGEGKEEIIAFGYSDNDESGVAEAVAVVLDPLAIVGDGESTAAGGFGVPASRAEKYYMTFPRSSIALALGRDVVLEEPAPVRLKDGEGFRVIAYGSQRHDLPVMEYIFDHTFRVLEVKSADYTKRVYDSLAAQSGNAMDFYTMYLPHIAAEVRYWDGRMWSEGRGVVVNHSP